MATTTNYSWDTPDDTDLVKDGAAAIRTLGSSIDTTTKALNPSTTLGDIEYRSSTANTNTRLAIGTTGQVLAVVGGVPAWATTADQTPLTTKGDLFTFDTGDARLAVGNNGETLVADSSTATGLKWAAPATPTFYGCRLSKSANQTITNNTFTALTFDTETFDSGGYHSTVSNTSRITIPTGKGGYYEFSAACAFNGSSSVGGRFAFLYKNGSSIWSGTNLAPSNTTTVETLIYTQIVSAVATDYFEFYVLQDRGGDYDVRGLLYTTFQATYLGV
jgi:hypothetical protein